MPKPPRRIVWAGLALFALLGTTLGLSFVPLGSLNIVIALTIAWAKGLIVVFVFMELARGGPLGEMDIRRHRVFLADVSVRSHDDRLRHPQRLAGYRLWPGARLTTPVFGRPGSLLGT